MAKLRVGDQAPEFELEGTGSRSYRLGDYRGRGVILAFYPGDFTPVCTKQFCSYRDYSGRIESLGMPLVGISPQSVGSHEHFANRQVALFGLRYQEVGDLERAVARVETGGSSASPTEPPRT